jgi:hypothetical protein
LPGTALRSPPLTRCASIFNAQVACGARDRNASGEVPMASGVKCWRYYIALLIALSCVPSLSAALAADESTSPVQSIDDYAAKIDREVSANPYEGWSRARGSDWRLAALGAPDALRYLEAKVQLGNYVRNERFYFRDGALVLVRVNDFWDVDSPKDAQRPPRSRAYHVSGEAIVAAKQNRTHRPAGWLIARATQFQAALKKHSGIDDELVSLEDFPWGEPGG